ncbi:MAG: helix-turn-helix domain-containing protein [Actinobacteria bacterium]|nr:helix-turn-helix domain-containing protein [Actinomycetota bacterium]
MPANASLTPREREVLGILVANRGRVLARHELAHQAGLEDLHDRRCDKVLVRLRERLGNNAIVTVRSRGWMLSLDAVGQATDLLVDGAGN